MKKVMLVVVGLAFVATIGFAGCSSKSGPNLKIDKKEFQSGEVIGVTYVAPETFEANAWIGIVPSDVMHGNEAVNDQHDIAYQYLNKTTSGKMTFNAPLKPGSYDFRMHDTDNNGKEVASVTFTVLGAAVPPVKTAAAGLQFNVDDKVLVEWHGSWWPAKVIEISENSWKIHYDGHESSWDEWVGMDRIKKQ